MIELGHFIISEQKTRELNRFQKFNCNFKRYEIDLINDSPNSHYDVIKNEIMLISNKILFNIPYSRFNNIYTFPIIEVCYSSYKRKNILNEVKDSLFFGLEKKELSYCKKFLLSESLIMLNHLGWFGMSDYNKIKYLSKRIIEKSKIKLAS